MGYINNIFFAFFVVAKFHLWLKEQEGGFQNKRFFGSTQCRVSSFRHKEMSKQTECYIQCIVKTRVGRCYPEEVNGYVENMLLTIQVGIRGNKDHVFNETYSQIHLEFWTHFNNGTDGSCYPEEVHGATEQPACESPTSPHAVAPTPTLTPKINTNTDTNTNKREYINQRNTYT